MINKELLLRKAGRIEDKLFVSRALDKAVQCLKSKRWTCTDFCDPYQQSLMDRVLSGEENIQYTFDGGYPGAERAVIVFRPDFIYEQDFDEEDSPLALLQVKHRKPGGLTHRDYLGSLLGAGIKREKIGDILVREDYCDIILMREVAEYLKYQLTKVSRVEVQAELISREQMEAPERKMKEIRTTVPSLRLDCIAGAGFGLSRGKIAELIKGEKVQVNWGVDNSLSRQLKEGDVVSVRGKGRIVLEQIGKSTKKGRIGVLIQKFI